MPTRLLRSACAGLASFLCASALLALLGTDSLAAQPWQSLLDDEAFRWRSVGPVNMGGRITDVEGIPFPSKTFYAAAAAGGIWKTTNNGTTFKQIWTDQRVISMGDLAIAPSDPDIVWAGTGEEDSRNSISPGGGIFRSTDGGESWEFKGLKETQVIARIVVHPDDPSVVYAAALGRIWGPNPERGLYRTKDGGESWELIHFISDRAGFVDIVLDPDNPDRIFAASWERVRGPYFLKSGGEGSALWLSEDGGDSWTEIAGNGFPTSEKGRIGLAIAPSNSSVVYAMVEARGEGEEEGFAGNGLYRSQDGGASWEKMNDVNTRPFYYSQVRVDPLDEDRVYFSSTPVRYSEDGGRTFGTTTNRVHVDHHAMWIDPVDPDRVIVGNDGGVAISYDRGGNWSYLNTMALGQFYDISVNMERPYRICGGLQDNGTWCGPSRVARGQITAYHWASVGGGDGFVTAQDPILPDRIWLESQGGNMGRVDLSTGRRTSLARPDWEDVWLPRQDSILALKEAGRAEDDPEIQRLAADATRDSTKAVMRFNWNTPFLQSAHNREWFYAAGNRVLKSANLGEDLEIISPDLTYADSAKIEVASRTTGGITPDVTGAEAYATITALDESPLRAGKLFAGTDDGRVWMTEDDGGSWAELTDRIQGVPAGTYVSRVKASSHDADRLYVAFDGHRGDDFEPYIFASDDNGERFRSIAAGLPRGSADFVHVIEEDPVNERLLFAGTDVAAYVSMDRGQSWARFMKGLHAVPVHDLEVHPRDGELIAGTHGRSIWIADIQPLQQMNDRIVAEGALLEPRPAARFGEPPRGGESPGQQYWGRPAPGSEARIFYYLTDEIVDAARGKGEDGEEAGERPSGRSSRQSATVVVTSPDGDTVHSARAPLEAGLHSVTWDLATTEEPEEPSAFQAKQRRELMERARLVTDSLVEAGWEESLLRRLRGLIDGSTGRTEFIQLMSGERRPSRDPEAFQERPGETPPGQGGQRGGGFAQMREVAGLILPGASMGRLMRVFGGGGRGESAPVPPGEYSVTITAGDWNRTQTLVVLPEEGAEASNTP